jgi:transcriptional regulator with XRE-family HTH domain
MTNELTAAQRLKSARKALGLSDSEMAAKLGLRGAKAKDDFRRMETGHRPISGPVLTAAEALVRIRDLELELARYSGGPVE